ncbi:MAG: Asp-tRNA(Asn)/Glu-tRNA(Gln) amidotransferase subunit GatB [Planctomycetales bacterium]
MSGSDSPVTIIGLEVHVQLLTKTKLFCGCANRFDPERPNEQTCPVCLGLPGALPVMNREAFQLALQTGIALDCNIPSYTKWDRKQYYYPDLPKGYQISQYDLPFSEDGRLEITLDEETGETKRVGIIRAHLEEDAGKNLHDEAAGQGDSRVDLNRCGTPLLEIVSEPDLRTPQEARTYLEELKLLLSYLEVSDCNMQEGSLRCDANVNLHLVDDDGHSVATPIVEIKNLNSFRAVEAAIEFEARRQLDEWERTNRKLGDPGVAKETRGWDEHRAVTFPQRGKEEASDYRYFPDPDLVPVTVSEDEVQAIRERLCEFPADRRKRLQAAYQLSAYDARVIIDQGRGFADYFETAAQACGDGKQAANWVTQDVLRELHERGISIGEFPIPAKVLGALLRKIVRNEITVQSGREVFSTLLERVDAGQPVGFDDIEGIVEERGLAMVADTGQLEAIVDEVIAVNAKAVEAVRGGKPAATGPLIGQVMKQLKGADAKVVRELLLDRIGRVG